MKALSKISVIILSFIITLQPSAKAKPVQPVGAGNYVGDFAAGISATAMIPGVGLAGKAGKVSNALYQTAKHGDDAAKGAERVIEIAVKAKNASDKSKRLSPKRKAEISVSLFPA